MSWRSIKHVKRTTSQNPNQSRSAPVREPTLKVEDSRVKQRHSRKGMLHVGYEASQEGEMKVKSYEARTQWSTINLCTMTDRSSGEGIRKW